MNDRRTDEYEHVHGNLTTTVKTTWILQPTFDCDGTVHTYCINYGFTIVNVSEHHLHIEGSVDAYQKAFDIIVTFCIKNGQKYHYTTTPLVIPKLLQQRVKNILGLDNVPTFESYHLIRPNIATRSTVKPFTPPELAALYDFPISDGRGQQIGIIELGGGYRDAELVAYLRSLGITKTPNVVSVSVDGATNNPADTASSYEVVLNLDIIASIVPDANIRVYFAPNSFQGFYNAINRAIMDRCQTISISWGARENLWSAGNLASYDALFETAANLDITIACAAGNQGSSNGGVGLNVDFPSSSPFVIACGGTTVIAENGIIVSETVWNNNSTTSATGGGFSNVFGKPDYQIGRVENNNGKRAVPDVSGNADPNAGYQIYFKGQTFYIGGTSAVSPLWTALIARINAIKNTSVGFVHPILYANPSAFRDITIGNNGFYQADALWDETTGNGSPNGQALLQLFGSGTVDPLPPAPPSPVAAFDVDRTSGTVPLTVRVTNRSSDATRWLWNFGDGFTSTLRDPPARVYNTAGTFIITLTASGPGGLNTLSRTITAVAPPPPPPPPPVPVAAFDVDRTSGIVPVTVRVTNRSSNATSWLWNFGDGFTSTLRDPPVRVYNTAGTFIITLTASGAGGSNTLSRTITAVAQPPRPPPVPVAAFDVDRTSGIVPVTVRVTNRSSNATSWLWNFGDGFTSTLRDPPARVYNTVRSFVITLTASGAGGSNTVSRTITAVAPPPPPVPSNNSLVANFEASVLTGKAPFAVHFTDTTLSTGAPPTYWLWSFGNGRKIGRAPTRVYRTPGIYDVTLTVRNATNLSSVTKKGFITVLK